MIRTPTRVAMDSDDIKDVLMKRRRSDSESQKATMLSTGSALLNLACSDSVEGAYLKGHYYFFVGDSQSGKTWLALSAFAEACLDSGFDDFRLIYDNAEDGALMNMARFFGKRVAGRLEPPKLDRNGNPVFSHTVESFYFHLADATQAGPCFYVLDSMDALQAEDDIDKFSERKAAFEKGTDVSGTYGVAKAKVNSTHIREAIRSLRQTGSILIIVSQTRDNIGFGFERKTRGGGHALRFYATLEIWTSLIGKITKTVRKKKRQLGVYAEAQVKKNRLSGKDRRVTIPIYHSYGIDDVGSCVDYLIDEGYWPKRGRLIEAEDFNLSGDREALIRAVESQDLEPDLRDLVGDVWREIERACSIDRKPRYE